MTRKKRFGVSQSISQGLSDTIQAVEHHAGIFRHVVLPLSRIELDPDNPRKLAITLSDVRKGLDRTDPAYHKKAAELEKLTELATTIKNSGIINPVVAWKGPSLYRIVAGERRCLASVLAGRTEIEARIFNEKPNAFDLKLIQWTENTAREDLSLNERLGNIHDIQHEYLARHPGAAFSATLLSGMTGLSLAQASYYMTVLSGPLDVKNAIQSGHLANLDKAAVISGVQINSLRTDMLRACLAGCTLKELRSMAQQKKMPFPVKPVANRQPGRKASRINMGSTRHTGVVAFLAKTLLETPTLSPHVGLFAKVDWNHYDHAARAFRTLVELLEKRLAGQDTGP